MHCPNVYMYNLQTHVNKYPEEDKLQAVRNTVDLHTLSKLEEVSNCELTVRIGAAGCC